MASIQGKLLNFLLRTISKKNFLRERVASGKSGFFDRPKPPAKVFRSCLVHSSIVNNRNVFTLSPRAEKDSGIHLLYFHGGAYVQNFTLFHWEFLTELVKETGCTIIAPDYPLAPGHTYKEAFSMGEILYKQLSSVKDPREFILIGDSSGGGFALALAQKMRNEQMVLPGRIILLSPWLDITLTNPDITTTGGGHPFLGIAGLRKVGALYAGDTDPADYLLSPVNGSLEGLGKIALFIGTNDFLLADARKLRSLAGSIDIDIDYYEYEGMFHAWMFLNFPEANKAKRQIINLIQQSGR